MERMHEKKKVKVKVIVKIKEKVKLKTILLVRFLKTILYKFHSFQFTRIIKKFDDDDYFTAFEPHFFKHPNKINLSIQSAPKLQYL